MSLKNSPAHHVVREPQSSLKDKSRSWAGEGWAPGSREQLGSYSNRNLRLTTQHNGSCLRNRVRQVPPWYGGVCWNMVCVVQQAGCSVVRCAWLWVWHGCYAMGWCGVVNCDLVWQNPVWHEVVCDMVWCGMIWCDMAWAVWCSRVWCGMVQHAIIFPIQCDMLWCGVIYMEQ